MNTTITNLIDEIRILQSKAMDEHMLESNFAAFQMCIHLCQKALKDERQQLVDTFRYAWMEGNLNRLTDANDFVNKYFKPTK